MSRWRPQPFAAFVAIGILCAALPVAAGNFGGFSGDGSTYLDDDARVCTLLEVGADGSAKGKPSCRPVRGADERATFRKPESSKALQAKPRNRALTLLRGKTTLVQWTAPAGIDRVEAIYEGKAGVVVEYRSGGVPGAVGFRLKGAGASPSTAPAPPPAAPPAKLEGTWEQRILPCEQAGVKLELKAKKFRLTIETRCQADRDRLRLAGSWSEENGALVLSFPQDEGPDEEMACAVAECEGERCIRCADEDVSFTLLPARRRP